LVADGLGDAALGLLLAVVAGGACAVQEEDDGELLLAGVVLGDEDDVFPVAVGSFVNLVDEAGLGVAGVHDADGEQRGEGEDAFHLGFLLLSRLRLSARSEKRIDWRFGASANRKRVI